jgi:hypothetical protein
VKVLKYQREIALVSVDYPSDFDWLCCLGQGKFREAHAGDGHNYPGDGAPRRDQHRRQEYLSA